MKFSSAPALTVMAPVLVPPPFSPNVPLVRFTVPVLLKGMPATVLVVPAPDTFHTPGLLIASPALPTFTEMSPPEVTLKVPLLLSTLGTVPLLSPKRSGVPPLSAMLSVMIPLLFNVRSSPLLMQFPLMVEAVPDTLVVPVPAITPPLHARLPVAVTEAEPPRKPLEKLMSVVAGTFVLKVTVAPLMFRGPAPRLVTGALKVSVPALNVLAPVML